MNIFKYLDYKKLILDLLEVKKKMNSEVSQQKMAEHIRVHSPFVSRVFSGKADFSHDQLFKICQYFDLNKIQSDFLHLLLEYSRTGIASRKKALKKEIEDFQENELDVKKNLDASMIGKEKSLNYLLYYSHPLYSIVHAYMHIPKFQLKPLLLKEVLGLEEPEIQRFVEDLVKHDFLEWDSRALAYKVKQNNIHLESGSPLVSSYRSMMRIASLQQIQSMPHDHLMAVSATVTISRETKNAIQAEMLECLQRIKSLVGKSDPDEVHQINFDFFPWSKR